ncbi:MAG: hypothetical protein ACIWVG_02385, partial [Gloeotrichia echinulata HAB0833]
MANRWLKTNYLLACTSASWLAALSPVPNIGKGIFYCLAIISGIQLVEETKEVITQDARRRALKIMQQELEQLEISLHTQQQQECLYEAYGTTYAPEVEQELKSSLEHLYREPSAEHKDQLPTSTNHEKAFYLAIKSAVEVKGETFVIEQIMKLWGR